MIRNGTENIIRFFPVGIHDKESFFLAFAAILDYPAWFGKNWDALRDFLRHFPTYTDKKNVSIVFQDVPNIGEDFSNIFLEIIKEGKPKESTDPVLNLFLPEKK